MLCTLCAAGILVFLLFIVLPEQRLSAELDRDIDGLKSRIEEQKVLFPVFKNLFEKSKTPETRGMPVPPRTKVSREEIPGVPKRLQEMAAAHRLSVREIVPEVNALMDASNRFLVRFAAAGQFTDLRGFLIRSGIAELFRRHRGDRHPRGRGRE